MVSIVKPRRIKFYTSVKRMMKKPFLVFKAITSVYLVSTFSIAADIRRYTSSILQAPGRRLLYRQKIGLFIWFWWKSDLECTEYSISPTFSGKSPQSPLPIVEGHYCFSMTIPLPYGQPLTPLPASLQQWRRGVFTSHYFVYSISHWKGWWCQK